MKPALFRKRVKILHQRAHGERVVCYDLANLRGGFAHHLFLLTANTNTRGLKKSTLQLTAKTASCNEVYSRLPKWSKTKSDSHVVTSETTKWETMILGTCSRAADAVEDVTRARKCAIEQYRPQGARPSVHTLES